MKNLTQWLKLLAAIAGTILLGELPVAKKLAADIDEHRSLLLPLTSGITMIGFLGLLWAWVNTAIRLESAISHEEVEQLAARTQVLGPDKQFSEVWLRGKTAGVQVPEMSWTFQELKVAWRAGTWWSDSEMRRKYIITAGGTLCILNGFALLMVLFKPASVKLLLASAVLYAVVRLIWAFWHA